MSTADKTKEKLKGERTLKRLIKYFIYLILIAGLLSIFFMVLNSTITAAEDTVNHALPNSSTIWTDEQPITKTNKTYETGRAGADVAISLNNDPFVTFTWYVDVGTDILEVAYDWGPQMWFNSADNGYGGSVDANILVNWSIWNVSYVDNVPTLDTQVGRIKYTYSGDPYYLYTFTGEPPGPYPNGQLYNITPGITDEGEYFGYAEQTNIIERTTDRNTWAFRCGIQDYYTSWSGDCYYYVNITVPRTCERFTTEPGLNDVNPGPGERDIYIAGAYFEIPGFVNYATLSGGIFTNITNVENKTEITYEDKIVEEVNVTTIDLNTWLAFITGIIGVVGAVIGYAIPKTRGKITKITEQTDTISNYLKRRLERRSKRGSR